MGCEHVVPYYVILGYTLIYWKVLVRQKVVFAMNSVVVLLGVLALANAQIPCGKLVLLLDHVTTPSHCFNLQNLQSNGRRSILR